MLKRLLLFVVILAAGPAIADPAPDLRGKTLEEINTEFSNAEFSLVVQQVEAVEPLGRVFLQIPSPGADMGEQGAVYVRVSQGLMIPVGITGRKVETVTDELEAQGFTVEQTVTQVLGVPKGTVAASIPPEETYVDATKEVVYLQVSGDPGVAVPNLVGLRIRQAEDTLSALGLRGKLLTDIDVRPIGSTCSGFTYYTVEITSSEPPAGAYLPKAGEVRMEGTRIVSSTLPAEPCTADGTPL